ncbi:MAG: hypothetical protein Q7S33_04375 [Nanoarchaeota archaeon]|nr:hypothetical protein [Nanoarchaeota archaeon]
MTNQRLENKMYERETIKDNPLCDFSTKEPLSLSVAEVVSNLDEGLVISTPNKKSITGTEIICCVYPSFETDGGRTYSDFEYYPDWREQRDLGLKDVGGAFIGREGDPFFYRITENKFRKGLKEKNRLKIDRIRKPLSWYDDVDRLMNNWFIWKDSYFNFVREILENISDVSVKKYKEPSVLVDAPVIFDDFDQIINAGKIRDRLMNSK